MPAPSTVTVTSKDGPAQAVSAQILSSVSRIDFQLADSIVQITNAGIIKEYDIAATLTLTATISSGVITMTINQAP